MYLERLRSRALEGLVQCTRTMGVSAPSLHRVYRLSDSVSRDVRI